MKKILVLSIALIMIAGIVFAYDYPSTNQENKDGENFARPGVIGPHVNLIEARVGEVVLEFVVPLNYLACFEYRSDCDTTQAISPDHYNPWLDDDLYPFVCVQNNTIQKTISVEHYVEIRLTFGGERDWDFDWTRFDALYPRSAEITSPVAGEEVSGIVSFEAYLNDNDVDAIQWAIRQGTCAANTNTVFGNVDGRSDTATIDASDLSHQAFSFSKDMSSLPLGMYCFVYNPVEDSGESNIRETVEFNLKELLISPPTDKDQCKKDGWKTFNNPFFKNQGDCVSYVQSNENAEGNTKDN